MYQFRVFTRSIFLLIMLSIFEKGAHALTVNNASLEINTESAIADNLHENDKPKTATTDKPPVSQLRDLNADGTPDFITTHSISGGVSIAFGRGNGKFEPPRNYFSGSEPLIIKLRDFNNDNTLDVVAYNDRQKTISVFLGEGNGGFTQQNPYHRHPDSMVSQSSQNNSSPTSAALFSTSAPIVAKASALTGLAAIKQSIHQKINIYRVSRGLPALALNAALSKVARIHSQNMASGKIPFGHQGFNARVRTLSKTLIFKSASENVGLNSGYSDPATVAVDSWLNSPGHLNNILGTYNLTGIGVTRNSRDEYYFTQIFWRR